jgi:hypothetical protein
MRGVSSTEAFVWSLSSLDIQDDKCTERPFAHNAHP